MLEFVQNSVFSPRSARFVIFALGVHSLHFSAKRTSLYTAVFSVRDQNVLSFSHFACYFLAIFSKVHEFVQNNVFSQTSARVVIFAVATPVFSDFKQSTRVCAHHFFAVLSEVHEVVQKRVFSPRSARSVIFALGAKLFSFFQQSAGVCTKQRFNNAITMFCHFRTACTSF